MENKRLTLMLLCVAIIIPLSGCTESLVGCGEAYNEMHMGDYTYQTLSVDSSTGVMTVVVVTDEYMGYVNNDDWEDERPPAWATLTIEMSDGSTSNAGPRIQNDWTVTADNGDVWVSTLTFESASGFCDNGCERVKFDGSAYTDPYNSIVYYDGTCDASPWVDI
jgi:hypothetical protein